MLSTNTALMTVGDTKLSLDLPKGQSFDDWVEVGQSLSSAGKVLNWWIGDWWAAGSHRYGERARLAAQGLFGREYSTLATYASVSRSFEPLRRRKDLSFGHHHSVAALDPEQADSLLDRAAADAWTVKDIRAEAASFRAQPPRETSTDDLLLSAMIGTWNRGNANVRERFLEMIDGTGPIEI